jgi:hypothetical protein
MAIVNRRSFFGVVAGGAAALSVRLPATPGLERLNVSGTSMSDPHAAISMPQYTSDAFQSRVGQVFAFHRTENASDPPIQLELVEVKASPHQAQAGGRPAFSLLFALRSDDATRESTLHLRHDDFEPCAWFVNRVTAPQYGQHTAHYEAVFG